MVQGLLFGDGKVFIRGLPEKIKTFLGILGQTIKRPAPACGDSKADDHSGNCCMNPRFQYGPPHDETDNHIRRQFINAAVVKVKHNEQANSGNSQGAHAYLLCIKEGNNKNGNQIIYDRYSCDKNLSPNGYPGSKQGKNPYHKSNVCCNRDSPAVHQVGTAVKTVKDKGRQYGSTKGRNGR